MIEQLKLHPLQRDCGAEGQHQMGQQRGHWIQGTHRQESRRKPAVRANALTSAQYRAQSDGGLACVVAQDCPCHRNESSSLKTLIGHLAVGIEPPADY